MLKQLFASFFSLQNGIAAPVLLVVVAVGLLGYLVVSSVGPFQDSLFSALNPKPESQAAAGDSSGATFFETFTANPSAPQPFTSSRWDIQVHERGMVHRAPGVMIPMDAQHGMDCGTPPAAHSINQVDQSVFNCRDHMMTSLNGDEYGVIYLTPNHMIDWSQGSAVLSFDISTEKMSGRDWPDVLLTPWADQQALPLLSPLSEGVDLQGPSKNTVSLSFATGEGAPILTIIRNNVRQEFLSGVPLHQGIVGGTNQAATRQPLKLTISDTKIKFERLASPTGQAIVFFDVSVAPIGFNQAVVQLGHHSYSPFKDNSGVAATWHWDNVGISPAVPFTMNQVTPRYLGDSGTVTFPPAPANAILRFAAIGRPVVNGVARNPVTYTGHPEHWSSYNIPVPQGSTSATIVMTKHDWYEHGYMAKDFAIWAPGVSIGGPLPTSQPSTLPTLAPSATPMPTVLPTIMPTPKPVITPAPTPKPTVRPTSTPAPVTSGSVIKIYAAGTPSEGVFPTLRLDVRNTSGGWKSLKSWTNVRGNPGGRQFMEFVYNSPTKVLPQNIRVRFTNDRYNPILGQDRNLVVDRINVDGVDIQTERSTTYSQGSWDPSNGCKAGVKRSEWLHCNGYFEYR